MFFLACLSPQEMQLSVQIGWYTAAFAFGIVLASTLLSLKQGSFMWCVVCAILLLVHPAWTMNVVGGDCGEAKRFMSGAVSFVLTALLMCQIFWPRCSRLRFLLVLCTTCWAAWFVLFLNRLFHFAAWISEGFIGAIFRSFVFSYHDLFRVAVGLTLICSALWLYQCIWAALKRARS